MAAVASNVSLTFGLMACTVSVQAALAPKPRNVMVCTGAGGSTPHELARISQTNRCPTCGDVHFATLQRAREVPEGLVLLNDADLTEARTDAAAFKKSLTLTPHPAAPVDLETVPGEKVYFLVPTKGQEQTYGVIASLVHAHPELAFLTRFTPRTNMGVFRLGVRDGALVMTERVQGDRLKDTPAMTLPDVPAPLAGMAEQVLALPGVITDFELAAYRDATEDKIAAIVAAGTPVAVADAARPDGASVPKVLLDPMAALAAQLEAAKAAGATPITSAPRRRTAAKKAAADAAAEPASATTAKPRTRRAKAAAGA